MTGRKQAPNPSLDLALACVMVLSNPTPRPLSFWALVRALLNAWVRLACWLAGGRAWSVKLNLSRPALRRTTERGMSTRAAATQRTTSSALGGAMPSNGVPATATCMRRCL